jgi:hypothetical protein
MPALLLECGSSASACSGDVLIVVEKTAAGTPPLQWRRLGGRTKARCWRYGSLTSRRVPTRSLIYVEEGKGTVKRISFPPK